MPATGLFRIGILMLLSPLTSACLYGGGPAPVSRLGVFQLDETGVETLLAAHAEWSVDGIQRTITLETLDREGIPFLIDLQPRRIIDPDTAAEAGVALYRGGLPDGSGHARLAVYLDSAGFFQVRGIIVRDTVSPLQAIEVEIPDTPEIGADLEREYAATEAPALAPTAERILRVAVDIDAEAVLAAGDPADAVNEGLSLFNSVEGMLHAAGFAVRVTSYRRWSDAATDPYDGVTSAELVDEVRNVADTDHRLGAPDGESVVYLLSGKEAPLTHGLAFVKAACKRFGVGWIRIKNGLDDHQLLIVLLGHMIGHNIGMEHLDCSSGGKSMMCATFSRETTAYAPDSLDEAAAYISGLDTALREECLPLTIE